MASQPKPQIQTTLAYMAVTVIAVSILSILATLLAALFQVESIPPIIVQAPLVGLPIGFLLVIALLISSIITRRRQNRD
jgi:hypothetical protein